MDHPTAQPAALTDGQSVLAQLRAQRHDADRARLSALLAEHPAPPTLPRQRRSAEASTAAV